MGGYRVGFRTSVRKDLRGIPSADVARIMASIAALAEDPRPHGAEKLSTRDRYRIRQGDYRIVYEIADDIVTVWVVKVGHRRDIYRGE
ncbi:MAG: type II toxin-antitoxin system RelE/ParE family toxin [Clostridiales bacterium]|nr:type II toxin-antitoxin system RelE/ParE family toxin [Clostridiales bacterium]